jgi:hypothetical protein
MRTKLGLLGLCAIVVGMMSMSAGAAQGATLSWLILNSAKTTATELKAELVGETDSSTLQLHGKVANGLAVTVQCTVFTLKGVNLETGGKLTEGGKVVFTGCKAFEDKAATKEYTKCTVKSAGATAGTVETNEGKGELVLLGGQVLTKVEPKAGPTGNFVTLKFEGVECTLTELNQVHGTLYLKDCEGFATTHKEVHLVEPEPTNTALYLGGHSTKQLEDTKLLGSGWIKLGGAHVNLFWSAMDI